MISNMDEVDGVIKIKTLIYIGSICRGRKEWTDLGSHVFEREMPSGCRLFERMGSK